MRLVQVRIPAGSQQNVTETLDDADVDYVVTDEITVTRTDGILSSEADHVVIRISVPTDQPLPSVATPATMPLSGRWATRSLSRCSSYRSKP